MFRWSRLLAAVLCLALAALVMVQPDMSAAQVGVDSIQMQETDVDPELDVLAPELGSASVEIEPSCSTCEETPTPDQARRRPDPPPPRSMRRLALG